MNSNNQPYILFPLLTKKTDLAIYFNYFQFHIFALFLFIYLFYFILT